MAGSSGDLLGFWGSFRVVQHLKLSMESSSGLFWTGSSCPFDTNTH